LHCPASPITTNQHHQPAPPTSRPLLAKGAAVVLCAAPLCTRNCAEIADGR